MSASTKQIVDRYLQLQEAAERSCMPRELQDWYADQSKPYPVGVGPYFCLSDEKLQRRIMTMAVIRDVIEARELEAQHATATT